MATATRLYPFAPGHVSIASSNGTQRRFRRVETLEITHLTRRYPMHFPEITERLAEYRPPAAAALPGARQAATAVVYHLKASGDQLLFLQRAQRPGDPWSGQISFPGGHAEAIDRSLLDTARREAREEVGFELPEVGYELDRAQVKTGPKTVVTPYVFVVDHVPTLTVEPSEVDRAFWVSVASLASPTQQTHYPYRKGGLALRFPGIEWDGRVIWGLTYRMLVTLFAQLEIELPSSEPLIESGDSP